jgi:hypothetical protein
VLSDYFRAGVANPLSLREDDIPALDLVLTEAHQPLAMRALDRKLASDGKPHVRVSAVKSRLLESNQPGARRIAAPDRQIPVGRGSEVIDRQFAAFLMMHPDLGAGRR